MLISKSETKNAETNSTAEPAALRDGDSLERRSWWNWFLLAGTLVLTTIGLGTAVPGFVSDHFANPWPWIKTDLVLIIAYCLLILTFVVYLTYQQRQLAAVHRRLRTMRDEAYEYSRRHNARLYALFDVSHIMGLETDHQRVFDGITKACVEAFECDQASLMLYNKDIQKLEVRSAHGHLNLSEVLGTQQKIGEGVAGWAAMHRKALLLGGEDNAGAPSGVRLDSKSICAAMVVPIVLRDELVGVVSVSSRSPDIAYDEDDLRALQVFAANAGTCIRHTEQSEWMRQTIRRLQDQQATGVQDEKSPDHSIKS